MAIMMCVATGACPAAPAVSLSVLCLRTTSRLRSLSTKVSRASARPGPRSAAKAKRISRAASGQTVCDTHICIYMCIAYICTVDAFYVAVGTMMMDLPNETLSHILEYVDANDLPEVLSTCRRIHALRGLFVPHVLRAALPDQQALDACLMRGVKQGDVHAVRALLCAGADANMANNAGWTALYVASDNGHTDIVRALLKAGADVDKADDYGETALYWASENGHTDIVRALRKAGALGSVSRNAICMRCVLC